MFSNVMGRIDMDAVASIQERYNFTFPELYRTLRANGHFSPQPWKNYLSFDNCEWLTLDAIANYKFLDFQITSEGGFVPFGVSSRNDEWCWRLDWATDLEPPVVFCEWGETGFGYAPDFRGFLYRNAMEEFAGSNDFATGSGKLADLQQAVAILSPHLPKTWGEQLQALAKHELNLWSRGNSGELYILPRRELEAIIADQLAFPHLNEVFMQDKARSKRLSP
jgi:hypothetical protein